MASSSGSVTGDDPASPRRFQPGSSDVFILSWPCMNPILCYLFFYRSGEDGWTPQNVTIIEQDGEHVNFLFDVPMPNNSWFGYNNYFPPPPPANAASLAVK
ncbi:hypothetical protein CDL12_20160 [Handroanthus impetiginosus]|uniref:Uncharacterized protein n=1 Tax=Handroanthus impetiginosus TaxID=429701 RepID=A0A2G9GPP6_9LAMI|nr:hypothetical protein CDL12_20160 [Handroanthus impetiginosus]